MLRRSSGLLHVESYVPYCTCISTHLCLNRRPLEEFERLSRTYERAFLAWETVRRVRNPFFKEGTGFEGYYIGRCQSVDEMIQRLLELGRMMLECNRRYFRYDYAFQARLMDALSGEWADVKALDAWSALLGATLGRLRCMANRVPKAGQYQSETYSLTNSVPPITYRMNGCTIRQEYTLPYPPHLQSHKLDISFDSLPPRDQDAAFVIWSVGRLGHPLVRQYLSEKSMRAW